MALRGSSSAKKTRFGALYAASSALRGAKHGVLGQVVAARVGA